MNHEPNTSDDEVSGEVAKDSADLAAPPPSEQAPPPSRGKPVFPPIGPTDTIKIRGAAIPGFAPPGREVPGHPGQVFGEAPVSDDPDVSVES